MAPRHHRIHLGRTDPPTSPPQNYFSTKVCCSGPHNWSKKVPRPKCQPGGSKSDPGLQNPFRGVKKEKMRAEKPSRTPPSEFQTEPYSASYGHKPFWGQSLNEDISKRVSKRRFPEAFWHHKGDFQEALLGIGSSQGDFPC